MSHSGRTLTLQQVAGELPHRLISLFLPGPSGRRPAHQRAPVLDSPDWSDCDNGAGLGAEHETGWTGFVADLIIGRRG